MKILRWRSLPFTSFGIFKFHQNYSFNRKSVILNLHFRPWLATQTIFPLKELCRCGSFIDKSTMVAKSVGKNSKILAVFCLLLFLPLYNVDVFRDMFNRFALKYDLSNAMSYLQKTILFRGERAIVFIYGVIY